MATATRITKELVKGYGVLSTSQSGWTKELNLISWNGRNPKLDLREWGTGKEKTGKGMTLKKGEAIVLKELLNSLDFDEVPEDFVAEEQYE